MLLARVSSHSVDAAKSSIAIASRWEGTVSIAGGERTACRTLASAPSSRVLHRSMAGTSDTGTSDQDQSTGAAAEALAEGQAASGHAAAADAAEAAGMAAAGQSAAGAQAGGAAAGPSSTAAEQGSYGSYPPKLVVFGGNGFVGTRVCQQGLAAGAEVVSISRSGKPRGKVGDWAAQVQWMQGDALDPQQGWRELLRGAAGVVSTLGAFGSNDLMYRICGEATMRVMDAAAEQGVPRFAFISVAEYKFPAGWHAEDYLLRGYFRGKRDAERHLARMYPDGGVALRPSFIYGSRGLGGGGSLPLGMIGAPLRSALRILPTRSLASIPIVGMAFVPPISVDCVGKAAATAVLDPSVPPGLMDVWDMEKYC